MNDCISCRNQLVFNKVFKCYVGQELYESWQLHIHLLECIFEVFNVIWRIYTFEVKFLILSKDFLMELTQTAKYIINNLVLLLLKVSIILLVYELNFSFKVANLSEARLLSRLILLAASPAKPWLLQPPWLTPENINIVEWLSRRKQIKVILKLIFIVLPVMLIGDLEHFIEDIILVRDCHGRFLAKQLLLILCLLFIGAE